MNDVDPAPTPAEGEPTPSPAPAAEPTPALEPSGDPSPPANGAEAKWFDSIEDVDVKGWAEKRQYTSMQDAVRGHMNLEKLRNVPADRLLEIPEDPSADGAMDAVFDKLGRPKAPDDYGLKAPEDVEDGWYDNDLSKHIAERGHKAGLNKAQMDAMHDGYVEYAKLAGERQAEEQKNDVANLQTNLREVWGANYEANNNFAIQGATLATDGEKDSVNRILGESDVGAMQFWAKIGSMMAEGNMPTDALSGTSESMTTQIKEIENGETFKEYMRLVNGSKAHLATQEMKDLAQRRKNLITKRAEAKG